MILAGVALDISVTLLTILMVVVCLLLILVVMMQRPKQEGLGAAFGGGMTDQLLGAGTTSFLQKTTVWLGSSFFLIGLILAILIGRQNHAAGLTVEKKAPLEEVAAPAVPENVDLSEESDELLEALEVAGGGSAEEEESEGVSAGEEVTSEGEPAVEEAPSGEEVAADAVSVAEEEAAPPVTENVEGEAEAAEAADEDEEE